VSATESNQSGEGREEREIPRGITERSSSVVIRGTFTRNMQVFGYSAVSCILIGLLIFVGWLYRQNKVNNSDTILMFILGQVLGLWVALTNKIFRIYGTGSEIRK
jgi:hypothetical protein